MSKERRETRNIRSKLKSTFLRKNSAFYKRNEVEVTQQLISEKPQKQVFSRFSSLHQ